VEDDDVNDELVRTFDELADLELARALEDVYCTPPLIEEDKESPYAFYVKYPIKLDI
jgi:hypothetical protein